MEKAKAINQTRTALIHLDQAIDQLREEIKTVMNPTHPKVRAFTNAIAARQRLELIIEILEESKE